MFKTVSLTAETWVKIVRRLTVEMGANDDSRVWADAITEQTSGSVTGRSVTLSAGRGGDLRNTRIVP